MKNTYKINIVIFLLSALTSLSAWGMQPQRYTQLPLAGSEHIDVKAGANYEFALNARPQLVSMMHLIANNLHENAPNKDEIDTLKISINGTIDAAGLRATADIIFHRDMRCTQVALRKFVIAHQPVNGVIDAQLLDQPPVCSGTVADVLRHIRNQ